MPQVCNLSARNKVELMRREGQRLLPTILRYPNILAFQVASADKAPYKMKHICCFQEKSSNLAENATYMALFY